MDSIEVPSGGGASGSPGVAVLESEQRWDSSTRSASSSWSDAIYLSADAILDGGDKLLATVPRGGVVPVGGSYTGRASPVLPNGIEGPFPYHRRRRHRQCRLRGRAPCQQPGQPGHGGAAQAGTGPARRAEYRRAGRRTARPQRRYLLDGYQQRPRQRRGCLGRSLLSFGRRHAQRCDTARRVCCTTAGWRPARATARRRT
jgi:hypothetical protein